MRDGIAFLENGELREPVQASGELACLCAEAVTEARARADVLVRDLSACTRTCAHALRRIEEEIRALTDSLAPRDVGFGDRKRTYTLVCRFLLHMEDAKNELQDAVLPLLSVGEQIDACRRTLYEAQAVASQVGALSDLREVRERLMEAEHTFSALCSGMTMLCTEGMPRFSERLSVCADLPGKGAECDVTSILRLCDALLFSVGQIIAF
ncbi:MAG: hypothetical protein IJX80_04010 [Clostridia bacterium]|nr:hypothetical protein [Clostridia bacterium]